MKKLYLVELQGMFSMTARTDYGSSYVVANDAESAYQKVKEYLDGKDYGFYRDRELKSITLLAAVDEIGAPNMLFGVRELEVMVIKQAKQLDEMEMKLKATIGATIKEG